MAAPETRSEKLDLRLSPTTKQKLRAAAELARRTVSEFVLDSALARADEALADRQRFGLDEAGWAEFREALDAPVRPMPDMKKLLNEPSIFDPK